MSSTAELFSFSVATVEGLFPIDDELVPFADCGGLQVCQVRTSTRLRGGDAEEMLTLYNAGKKLFFGDAIESTAGESLRTSMFPTPNSSI